MNADESNPATLREVFKPVVPGADWPPFVEELLWRETVPPETMDRLWAEGWRHFGPQFFRYTLHVGQEGIQLVQPLRVALERSVPSRGQRRVLRRNSDLEVRVQPPRLDAERRALFDRHRRRFRENVPDALEQFLGPTPEAGPGEMVEVAAYDSGRLVAASYLDLGRESASGVYAIFDPACARRSLGIATMLWEMACARSRGRRFYYPGYAFHGASQMDYKKQFAGTEWFDWRGRWRPLSPAGGPARK